MNAANLNFYNASQKQTQQIAPMDRLVSMLNGKAGSRSPLEAAKQALLDAASKLEQHRNEQIETAMAGYRALRSRQTSYERELDVQQKQLETYQTLSSRRETLTDELSSARADCEAYTAAEATLDITQHNRLSLRVSSLENELASVNHDISALVDQANRYTNSQKKYADYLKNTDQAGYAAYEYLNQVEFTEENIVSETSGMISRMETKAEQWRDCVSSYCEKYGLTPYDFECYLQERHKLADAYSDAQQRVSELLRAISAAAEERAKQAEPAQEDATPGRGNFDTVEISGGVLAHTDTFSESAGRP